MKEYICAAIVFAVASLLGSAAPAADECLKDPDVRSMLRSAEKLSYDKSGKLHESVAGHSKEAKASTEYVLPDDVAQILRTWDSLPEDLITVSRSGSKEFPTIDLTVKLSAAKIGDLAGVGIHGYRGEATRISWGRVGQISPFRLGLAKESHLLMDKEGEEREAIQVLATSVRDYPDSVYQNYHTTLASIAKETGMEEATKTKFKTHSGALGMVFARVLEDKAVFSEVPITNSLFVGDVRPEGLERIAVIAVGDDVVRVSLTRKERWLAYVRGTYLHAEILDVSVKSKPMSPPGTAQAITRLPEAN